MDILNRETREFSFSASLEQESMRLWVMDYRAEDPLTLLNFLKELGLRRGVGKIILPVRTKDLKKMQGNGFVLEGSIQGYYNGSDAHFLAAYLLPERGFSDIFDREMKMLHDIMRRTRKAYAPLPDSFILRRAEKSDCTALAELYKSIFSSYPTPVYDPQYVASSIENGDIYMVAYSGRRLIAAAAAEIYRKHDRAEITNCATDLEYRGMGLNTVLINSLEESCQDAGIKCLYSLARASSYGMNFVLHSLGYDYSGTLVNNCHIAGRFEDMNIWVMPDGEKRSEIGFYRGHYRQHDHYRETLRSC